MWHETVQRIVKWLRDELAQSHTDGFVVGLSGGLDSSVCAALLKKATDNCLGLILPLESDVNDIDDASEVASLINLRNQYIDLTPVYAHLIRLLSGHRDVALGNIKARLRMVVIYYYANINNYLVCGTGNKTEISLGYFTKYGDGACDILPLGDLYKYEVKKIAEVLGIPKKIVEKAPSAGLWKGQTDEGEIGFTYEEMDRTLKEIAECRVHGAGAERLQSMMSQSEHKRRPPRICYLRSQMANTK